MTVSASHEPKSAAPLSALLLAPFRAVGRFLVALAEASPQAKELARLNRMSDEQLAAKGLTRGGEIRRILGLVSAI